MLVGVFHSLHQCKWKANATGSVQIRRHFDSRRSKKLLLAPRLCCAGHGTDAWHQRSPLREGRKAREQSKGEEGMCPKPCGGSVAESG